MLGASGLGILCPGTQSTRPRKTTDPDRSSPRARGLLPLWGGVCLGKGLRGTRAAGTPGTIVVMLDSQSASLFKVLNNDVMIMFNTAGRTEEKGPLPSRRATPNIWESHSTHGPLLPMTCFLSAQRKGCLVSTHTSSCLAQEPGSLLPSPIFSPISVRDSASAGDPFLLPISPSVIPSGQSLTVPVTTSAFVSPTPHLDFPPCPLGILRPASHPKCIQTTHSLPPNNRSCICP